MNHPKKTRMELGPEIQRALSQ